MVADGQRDPAAAVVRRRAPFSDNPAVGRRGQQTQQRIVEATVEVLSEQGYQRCSVDRITSRAGCSRVAFYQYFASKDDVLQQLASQVAAQVRSAVEALDPVTADVRGRNTIRNWVTAYGDIHERYGALFHAIEATIDDAETLTLLRGRVVERNVTRIRAKLADRTIATSGLDTLLELMLETTGRTYNIVGILRSAAPDAYPRAVIEDALADTFHRAVFGRLPDVNVHGSTGDAAPFIPFDLTLADVLRQDDANPELSEAARATLEALLHAGRTTFAARGYYGTRVDDIVAAAGLSHGAFYRYFNNKAHFARVLVLRAMRPLSTAVREIPTGGPDGAPTTAALRAWLERYNSIQVGEAGMIRIWMDAALHDRGFGVDAAGALDWARRRNVAVLRHRGFGDVDADSVVLSALLNAFAARRADAAWTGAALHVIEHGLLGR